MRKRRHSTLSYFVMLALAAIAGIGSVIYGPVIAQEAEQIILQDNDAKKAEAEIQAVVTGEEPPAKKKRKTPAITGTGTESKAAIKVAKASPQEMKLNIVSKNIFKPAIDPPIYIRDITPEQVNRNVGPQPLTRPFTFIAFDMRDEQARAHLLFEKPTQPRTVVVGDVIEETIVILEIQPTYIRCSYANEEVRIDIGETSNDALARLKGFEGREYELIGTTVQSDESFAHILITSTGELRRVEIGDWLGETEIVDIQPGQIKLRYKNGDEINIYPTTRTKP